MNLKSKVKIKAGRENRKKGNINKKEIENPSVQHIKNKVCRIGRPDSSRPKYPIGLELSYRVQAYSLAISNRGYNDVASERRMDPSWASLVRHCRRLIATPFGIKWAFSFSLCSKSLLLFLKAHRVPGHRLLRRRLLLPQSHPLLKKNFRRPGIYRIYVGNL